MFYASRVIDLLYIWQTRLIEVVGVLLLEALTLAMLSRRQGTWASPSMRVLMVVTLALAAGAGLLAGYTAWQVRTLDLHIPFTHLPDGSIQYMPPPVVGIVTHAGPALVLSAMLILLLEGVALVRFLVSRLRTVGRFRVAN